MTREYYLAPADVVALLYLSRFGYDALRAQRPVAIAGAAGILLWVFQQHVRDAAFRVERRKEFVEGNARLAEFLAEYYPITRTRRPVALSSGRRLRHMDSHHSYISRDCDSPAKLGETRQAPGRSR